MRRVLLFLFFICLVSPIFLFCEEVEINSEVFKVISDKEHFIIKAGEDKGIEIGDGLIVHRKLEKIAEAKVIEVRSNVAMAELLTIEKGKEIKEGDSILIVKNIRKKSLQKPEEVYKKPKKSKWTTILGDKETAKKTTPLKPTSSIGELKKTDVTLISIASQKDNVFSYAMQILREAGFSVIFSNRTSGIITASKPISLSLWKELWADATASIDHKLVVSFDIKDNDTLSELQVSAFKEYSQKDKVVKLPVNKGSTYYNELVDIATKIKERSER